MNCFIFEYHFAFYYVTKASIDKLLVKYDGRRIRESSVFGGHQAKAQRVCRHIYEEQMSFFLVGTGPNLYYCYQLGEMYFKVLKDAELRTFVHRPEWTPSTLFLSWIAMALHHVSIRWHNAIAAVDDLVASEKDVVFLRANNMSKQMPIRPVSMATDEGG